MHQALFDIFASVTSMRRPLTSPCNAAGSRDPHLPPGDITEILLLLLVRKCEVSFLV